MFRSTCLHLLGAAAWGERLFTVFPGALERLRVAAAVISDQVLLQMLRHPKDQRAAVPLSTQHTVRNNSTRTSRQDMLHQVISSQSQSQSLSSPCSGSCASGPVWWPARCRRNSPCKSETHRTHRCSRLRRHIHAPPHRMRSHHCWKSHQVLVDGHTHHHVLVSTVDLQLVVRLRGNKEAG